MCVCGVCGVFLCVWVSVCECNVCGVCVFLIFYIRKDEWINEIICICMNECVCLCVCVNVSIYMLTHLCVRACACVICPTFSTFLVK